MSNVVLDRRNSNLRSANIREVLPEHHLSDYPNLILFLEKYYDFLETDATMAFAKSLTEMYKYRDINDSPANYLDLLIQELSGGLVRSDFFIEPRFASRLLSIFYRVKGSLYSAESFFRAFYGVNAEIEYPKRNIFTVGESKIGPEDLAIIQDGALYQVYSILIKSPIPLSEWNNLYKSLVHPSGFYLGSQVVITSQANIAQNDMPIVLADSDARFVAFTETASAAFTLDPELTGLTSPESDGTRVRYDINKDISEIATLTAAQVDKMYQSVGDLVKVSSPTFDEDSDVNGSTIDFSNTIEKFDEVKYSWYDSDSA